uniref:Uncharacterized protein n=1 Tax=Plectus sambesii TaxID=2011161 RepID=A0A914VKY8_9BILA
MPARVPAHALVGRASFRRQPPPSPVAVAFCRWPWANCASPPPPKRRRGSLLDGRLEANLEAVEIEQPPTVVALRLFRRAVEAKEVMWLAPRPRGR